ncbi:MAG TPA: cytochrome c maturation protein CcmE [Chloroflexota bacterium]|nr:cytochrome c maturation protein CcmE [Chloroflexota bacterium]
MLTEDTAGNSTRAPHARSTGRGTTRHRPRTRLKFLVAGLIIVVAIGYMIYAAIQSGSEYFLTTGELRAMGEKAVGQQTKLGGRVVEGSLQGDKGGNTITFVLTDGNQNIPVSYRGTVPDSFQPGTDCIVEGKLTAGGTFQATGLMAKCASKYTPANR